MVERCLEDLDLGELAGLAAEAWTEAASRDLASGIAVTGMLGGEMVTLYPGDPRLEALGLAVPHHRRAVGFG